MSTNKSNESLKIKSCNPQVRLQGAGKTQKYAFCTTPELEADLDFIRNWYGDKLGGRSLSASVIVRRSLVILSDHLKNLKPGDESDRELIRFLMLAGSRGKGSIK
jgi:hypothetical protein